MDMNIIFQENMCLTDLNHYKHSKMTIFWVRFNTEKNKHCICQVYLVACNLSDKRCVMGSAVDMTYLALAFKTGTRQVIVLPENHVLYVHQM